MVEQEVIESHFVLRRLRDKIGRYFSAAKLKILAQGVNGLLQVVAHPGIAIEDNPNVTVRERNHLKLSIPFQLFLSFQFQTPPMPIALSPACTAAAVFFSPSTMK